MKYVKRIIKQFKRQIFHKDTNHQEVVDGHDRQAPERRQLIKKMLKKWKNKRKKEKITMIKKLKEK